MGYMDNILRNILGKLFVKQAECPPDSEIEKIKEMFSKLPDSPRSGKAPEWKKRTTITDGQNGESTS